MPKTKITLPERFTFTTEIPIRITDLNYGGHVGNDSVLSILHEIRVQFLRHHEYTELDLAGTGIIMADVAIEFKLEVFYGETIRASVAAAEFSRVGFDIYYKLEKISGQRWVTVAVARTGMVCYNYSQKKIASVPKEVCTRLLS
ncbi:MAG: thioesterase [Sphingobacteriales bacterium 50-39]|nr:thioesterase family protein [Sphingobacteriales bacterium]OJW57768.1 MAG: thioesterase [Sphingobacteriales bacterium 50-39]